MDLKIRLIEILLWFIAGLVAGYTTSKVIDSIKLSKDRKRMNNANREMTDYINSLKKKEHENWRK